MSGQFATLYLILIYSFISIMTSTAADDVYVHCKMKTGCTQCDPIPKDYPITCKNKGFEKLQEEIDRLKETNVKLFEKIDRLTKTNAKQTERIAKLEAIVSTSEPHCEAPKVFTNCASKCQPTCKEPNPRLSDCARGCDTIVSCVCPDGMVQRGNINRTCLRIEDCPAQEPLCKAPKVFTRCASKCQPTCKEPNPRLSDCARGCDSIVSCVCPDGMVQRDNINKTCLMLKDCPVPVRPETKKLEGCKAPKVFIMCASKCPPTCKDPQVPSDCARVCIMACVCPDGMVLRDNINRTCLRLEDCPDQDYEGKVRLVNGTSLKNGRVEVLYNGIWGTVCDDFWIGITGENNANVVCKQLGFTKSTWYKVDDIKDHRYSKGFGKIWLNEVRCTGNENFISDCLHAPLGRHDCNHHEDVAVECE